LYGKNGGVRPNINVILLPVLAALVLSSASGLGARSRYPLVFNGCWEQASYASRDRVAKDHGEAEASKIGPSVVTLCFYRSGALDGYYLEPTGEGGDFGGQWRFQAKNRLFVFRFEMWGVSYTQSCAVKYSEQDRLSLSGCSYPFQGEFRLICKDPRHPTDCSAKPHDR
jgi:hypothetical protein